MTVRRHIQDPDAFPMSATIQTNTAGFRLLATRASAYSTAIRPVIAILVPGCTWGLPEHEAAWARVVQDVANAETRTTGISALLKMARFPALIALYAGGIAGLHRRRYGTIRAVAVDAIYRGMHEPPVPLIGAVHPGLVFEGNELTPNVLVLEAEGAVSDEDIEGLLTGRKGRRHTPVSDYLNLLLRPYFAQLIVDDREYNEVFDALEVLLGVIATDLRSQPNDGYIPGPWYGSFTWRDRHTQRKVEQQLLDRLRAEADAAAEVQAGLFGGSSERAIDAAEAFVEMSSSVRAHY